MFYAYVLLTSRTVQLYVLDTQRIDANITAHFHRENITVNVHAYDQLTAGIEAMLRADATATIKVLLSRPSQALVAAVPAGQQLLVASPVNRMKVVKNAVEAAGMWRAHRRDGAAVIKYMHWLDGHIDGERVTELSGAAQLAQFRA